MCDPFNPIKNTRLHAFVAEEQVLNVYFEEWQLTVNSIKQKSKICSIRHVYAYRERGDDVDIKICSVCACLSSRKVITKFRFIRTFINSPISIYSDGVSITKTHHCVC